MTRLVYVLNGPNLNLLGRRQPEIYGHETLADVERACQALAAELGLALRFHQSNREYEIIDWVHAAREDAGGILINPAAFTHTSVAILDALNAFEGPVIEVHISNVHKRRGLPPPQLRVRTGRWGDRRVRHRGLLVGAAAAGKSDRRSGVAWHRCASASPPWR